MKAEYSSLLYVYESNHSDILNIMSDKITIAMEADETALAEVDAKQAVTDTVKSDETKQVGKITLINKVVEKVKNLIRKIGEMFSQLSRKMTNRLRLMGETDKGFFKVYNKRKAMVKPYQSVKVISYQYHNDLLDQPIQKLLSETLLCFDKLRAVNGTTNGSARITEIITAPQGKTIEVLLQPYAKNSDTPVTTVEQFVKYILTQYRGEKKELLYRDTQLSQIEANALSTKKIANLSNQYISKAKEAFNKLKDLEFQIKRSSNDPEVVKMVSNNSSKGAIIYNAYSALVNAYYELKLEESLNYRIILKKFYQF